MIAAICRQWPLHPPVLPTSGIRRYHTCSCWCYTSLLSVHLHWIRNAEVQKEESLGNLPAVICLQFQKKPFWYGLLMTIEVLAQASLFQSWMYYGTGFVVIYYHNQESFVGDILWSEIVIARYVFYHPNSTLLGRWGFFDWGANLRYILLWFIPVVNF